MAAQKNQNQTQTKIKLSSLKTLLTWEAPERPFKKRGREYFTTAGAIVFLLALIMLFLQEWLLIIVMIALVFVSYIMATVEPRLVKHEITNKGIVTGGRRYQWQDLGRFWFSEKWEQKMLNIESFAGLPSRLTALLGELKPDQVKKILSDYLPYEEPEKTWVEQSSEWVSRRVPLEK